MDMKKPATSGKAHAKAAAAKVGKLHAGHGTQEKNALGKTCSVPK